MTFDFKYNKFISLLLIFCIISLFIISSICQPAYALAGVDDALIVATAGALLVGSGFILSNSQAANFTINDFLTSIGSAGVEAITNAIPPSLSGSIAVTSGLVDLVSSYISAKGLTASSESVSFDKANVSSSSGAIPIGASWTISPSVYARYSYTSGDVGPHVTVYGFDGNIITTSSSSSNDRYGGSAVEWYLTSSSSGPTGSLEWRYRLSWNSSFSYGNSIALSRLGNGIAMDWSSNVVKFPSVSTTFDSAYAPSLGGAKALSDGDVIGFPSDIANADNERDIIDGLVGVSPEAIRVSTDVPADITADGEISPDGSGDFNIGKFILSIPILGHILQALLTIVDGISNIVSWLTSTFVEWLSGLFSGIQFAIISAINSLGTLLDRILDKIGAVASSIISAISGIWSDFAQWFPTSPLGIAINGIKDFLSNIFDLLKDILKALAGFLDSIIDTLPAILGLLSGYTLFMNLFNHFLPAQVVVVLWAFFECCIAVLIFRLILGR